MDNYRWLEDAKSPETRAFIDAQNAYTTRYLKQARIRPQVVDDLDALEHVSSWSLPIERAGNYFFMKRLAGEEQASIYRAPRAGPAKMSASSIPPNSAAIPTPLSALPMSPATARCWPISRARAEPTKPPSTSSTSKPVRSSKTSCPPPSTSGQLRPRRQEPLLRPRRSNRERCSTSTLSVLAHRKTNCIFGREFHGEELGTTDLFCGQSHRRRPLSGHRDRPRRARQTRGHRLSRPHQSRLSLRRSGLGTRLALLRHLRQRRMVREDRLQSPQRMHPQGRSRHHARGLEDNRSRRPRRDRRLLHRRRQSSTSSGSRM